MRSVYVLGMAAALALPTDRLGVSHGVWASTTHSMVRWPPSIVPGPGVPGTRLLIEPRDGVRPLLALINRAHSTIFVECYILSDRPVIHALQRAAAEGVSVYVVLEHRPFGMGAAADRIAQLLLASGVWVHWSSPAFVFTHSKFLVIDDRVAVVATANLSASAFHRNREVMVVSTARREVHELSNLFRSDWDRLPVRIHDSNLVVAPRDARFQLTRLIHAATKTLRIYAEEVADRQIEGVLVQQAKRILVQLLVPSSASRHDLLVLEREGIQVRALRRPYIHAKVVLVDHGVAFVGSENWSSTSLDHNREVGILLRGDVVTRLSHLFSRDWSHATRFR